MRLDAVVAELELTGHLLDDSFRVNHVGLPTHPRGPIACLDCFHPPAAREGRRQGDERRLREEDEDREDHDVEELRNENERKQEDVRPRPEIV